MFRPRIGGAPMSSAERQARRRARLRQQRPAPPAPPTRRLAPRPARWAAAVATLVRLQEEYRDWLDNLPPNLESSALADSSYRQSSRSTSKSCRRSTYHAATVETDQTMALDSQSPIQACPWLEQGAWIWLFSSIQNTRACSGGLR